MNEVVNVFRTYNNSVFNISIIGLGQFANKEDKAFAYLLAQLAEHNFYINMNPINAEECFCILQISGKDKKTNEVYNFYYNIQDLMYLIDLSSKTNISVVGIIVMKIVSMLICRIKTLYKAIVLDLDDTLWDGTLSEDGIEQIKYNQTTKNGIQYKQFANFVKALADNLGIYVAVCSRNDSTIVSNAIETLEESAFPLKHSIDCVVANNNEKSVNIKEIANSLSILPSSIVFIDDNKLVRDEVKSSIPEICVPNWNTHEDLITLLSIGCIFDRYELSLNAQSRRKQYKMIQVMRSMKRHPVLSVKRIDDVNHNIATKLYKKTNQFNMSQLNGNFNSNVKSVCFEICRENGESLGVCSAISYIIEKDRVRIENWAISCRFFEIGIEELILIYLIEKACGKQIVFRYCKNGYNRKATAFVENNNEFGYNDNAYVEFKYTLYSKERLISKTNLKMVE